MAPNKSDTKWVILTTVLTVLFMASGLAAVGLYARVGALKRSASNPKPATTCKQEPCPEWTGCIPRNDNYNFKYDTFLGHCEIEAGESANWNIAFAYPGGKDLGRITFWSCSFAFTNKWGYTSPISRGYDLGDCYDIEKRECSEQEDEG
jgi:hypothetical protein